MVYIFDTSSLIVLFKNFYLDRFPSLWDRFDVLLDSERILSVREVKNEVVERGDRLSTWSKTNHDFFQIPTEDEMAFVTRIFAIKHFQSLVRKKERLSGKPVADPFVIAKAAITDNGCVITEETFQDNAAKIPNICKRFGVQQINLNQFMTLENWVF